MTKPIPKILMSFLGDRYYIATKYTQSGEGFKATEKFDITDQVDALLIAHGERVIGENNTHNHPTREYCDDCAVRYIENKLISKQRLRNQTGDKS